MKISEQQIVESCRAWFQLNRPFFNFEGIAARINEDLQPRYLTQWVFGSDVLNNEDEVAAVDWAKEHGFQYEAGSAPIQAEFTLEEPQVKLDGAKEFFKVKAAESIGREMLKLGLISFEGPVARPYDATRVFASYVFRAKATVLKL